jgi:hypothetical protein
MFQDFPVTANCVASFFWNMVAVTSAANGADPFSFGMIVMFVLTGLHVVLAMRFVKLTDE